MVRARDTRWVRRLAVCVLMVPGAVAAAQPYIYQFQVERQAGTFNGQGVNAFLFNDPFNGADGGPPPNAPDIQVFTPTGTVAQPTSYFVHPTGAFSGETETGKLRLGQVFGPNSFGGSIQQAYLQTSTSLAPGDALRGLREYTTFSALGKFDLVDPGPSAGYGIAFSDPVGSSGFDDALAFAVRNIGGTPFVGLNRAGTPPVVIGNVLAVTQGHPFITLRLDHTEGSSLVSASFSYDGTTFIGIPDPLSKATMFHGENFTLASFYMTSPAPATSPVPEPSTYAMLLAGLALLGLAVRRRAR